MRNLDLFTKLVTLFKDAAILISIGCIAMPACAETVNLKANFRLYGEVTRFGIGYGDMALHFGINVPFPALAPEIGTFGFFPGGTSYATGVLEGLGLPPYGFMVVDHQFSVPFSLDVDQPASLYAGLNDNGIGGPWGGNVQVIFDFSDNIYFGGSIIGYARDQGLSLISVTLVDGTPLENVGLKFEFIPENTVLTAGASAADQGIIPVQIDRVIAASAPCGRAFVIIPNATASAKLKGGFDFCGAGIATDALLDLDILPEPDPFVYDLAYATVSGNNNVKLTRAVAYNTPPVTNAGPNVTITSNQQCQTVIAGQISDPDNDPLQYRWLEGQTELLGWGPAESNGAANLNLCPLILSLG